MYFTGIIIAVCTFLTIGIWHPIVIKTEYRWGTRPWVVYLLIGIVCIIAALFIENTIISAMEIKTPSLASLEPPLFGVSANCSLRRNAYRRDGSR